MPIKPAALGSVSTATLRDDDLLESLSSELSYQLGRNARVHLDKGFRQNARRLIRDAEKAIGTESEDSGEIISELSNALQAFAPPYCYFGNTEGDGADFGFWFCGMDSLEDLPRVSDPGETAKHRGEDCYFVNDHGNVTVYNWRGVPILELV